MKECAEEIRSLNAHTMVSIWPNMASGGQNHEELLKAGFLLNDFSTYNAFDENARAMYWRQAKGLLEQGFDSWWCDSTEPFPDPTGAVREKGALGALYAGGK